MRIDVRRWRRDGLLRPGRTFFWSWYRGDDDRVAIIDAVPMTDAVVLLFRWRGSASSEWKSVEQRVPLVWTRCNFGGARPWFRCVAYVGGRLCGRRVAKLYLRDPLVFACRHCCGLAYASQQEIPRHRAISRAQKIRMRLGGSANLLEPFPKRPRRMHRLTYHRLLAGAMAAQERCIALESDFLRRRFPGLLREENVVGLSTPAGVAG
jgi:hypothetical protein